MIHHSDPGDWSTSAHHLPVEGLPAPRGLRVDELSRPEPAPRPLPKITSSVVIDAQEVS